MKKYLLLLTCSFISIFGSYSQSKKDVEVLKNTIWKTENLGNGLVWQYFHFQQKELFESNQSIHILRSKLKNKAVKFALGSADIHHKESDTTRKLLKTSLIAATSNALVAVNGGFFNTKKGGAVDLIKIDGKVLDTATYNPRKALPDHSRSAIVIHKNKIAIVKGDTLPFWERKLSEESIIVTGPLLLFDDKEEPLKNNAFTNNRHPRTCACITKTKEILLITVDGRNTEAQGMSLQELTFLTKNLGCKNAINLDGGGSTTMYIKNKPDHGVVNFPSDNKLFDHFGERSVSNILMIVPK